MKELTLKQKAFVNEYVIDLNGMRAYAKVYGVKDSVAKSNASRLLSNVNIVAYMRELMEKKDKITIASQDEVLNFLTQTMRGEKTQEQAVSTVAGAEIVTIQTPLKDRIKAAELLGKRYAMFTDKVQADVNDTRTVIVEDI